jgi:hypothetical protein
MVCVDICIGTFFLCFVFLSASTFNVVYIDKHMHNLQIF